jgi:hypothetical protein
LKANLLLILLKNFYVSFFNPIIPDVSNVPGIDTPLLKSTPSVSSEENRLSNSPFRYALAKSYVVNAPAPIAPIAPVPDIRAIFLGLNPNLNARFNSPGAALRGFLTPSKVRVSLTPPKNPLGGPLIAPAPLVRLSVKAGPM